MVDSLPRVFHGERLCQHEHHADQWYWKLGDLEGGMILHYDKRRRRFNCTYSVEKQPEGLVYETPTVEEFVTVLNELQIPVPPPEAFTRTRWQKGRAA